MTDKEIEETSLLFSEHYGLWSADSPYRAGERIKMSPKMIKMSFVDKPDRYVALVYDGETLVGHIFYLRRKFEKKKYITWILQLVVKKEYRGNQIGTKLLHSIWQLSDSYAWGLYTSNPMTIKALEMATMRTVSVKQLEKNLNVIKACAIDLFENTDWINSYENGQVNTRFFTEHSELKSSIEKAYPQNDFPLCQDLKEGYEWLAFTFKNQRPSAIDSEQLEIYLDYSEEVIKEAYSSMHMEMQSWSSHTVDEVDVITKYFPKKSNIKLCDFGCGKGRHAIELSRRGYNVTGVDFSDSNIKYAMSQDDNVKFVVDDVRKYRAKKPYDVILCMYDVVGSFPNEKDNFRIITNAYKNLKKDGKLILSVMNMTLTKSRCNRRGNLVKGLEANIDKLLSLQSTNDMQSNGDVFDGSHILIDYETGVTYRKEKFFSDDCLPKEVVIRDRRYTISGITKLLQKGGFFIEEIYCFSAKDMSKSLSKTHKKAKEIFIVAQKMPLLQKWVSSLIPFPNSWKEADD